MKITAMLLLDQATLAKLNKCQNYLKKYATKDLLKKTPDQAVNIKIQKQVLILNQLITTKDQLLFLPICEELETVLKQMNNSRKGDMKF